MKKYFSLVLILSLSFFSCSSPEPKEKKENAASDSIASTVKTDSGIIRLGVNNAANETQATLLDANGNIKAKGMFINNKAAGAWVRYDETGNVIGAEHYFDGKPIHNLDKNDFVFRQWENKKLGAKFLVPEKWVELKSDNSSLVASFEKNISDTSVYEKPNFNIVRAKLDTGQTLDKLAKQQIEMYHQNFQRLEIVEENSVVVDSCMAFRWYGMYQTPNNKIGFMNMIIVYGNDAWLFSCEAQNRKDAEFLQYQAVFQQIAESFHRVN